MTNPRLSRAQLAFMIAVPVAWAALLMFHPNPTRDIHAGLHDEASTWMIVHVGTLVFIGLIGAVLLLLVRGLPGRAAEISRWAVLPYVLFYGAGEAILGVATGVLVQHAIHVPESERPAAADAVQALWDNVISADLIVGLGTVAWLVAIIAAAVAIRQSGAPIIVSVLIGAAAIAGIHTPPFGPAGLACLAAAIGVLAVWQNAQPAGVDHTQLPVGRGQ